MSGYELSFTSRTGVVGYVKLEQFSDPPHAEFFARFYLNTIEGAVVVRDNEVPLPRQPFEIRADGLWSEAVREAANEHGSFGMEAFGLIVADEHDEIGERMPVGYDVEWEVGINGPPIGEVHGEVLIGRERYDVAGVGKFSELGGGDR